MKRHDRFCWFRRRTVLIFWRQWRGCINYDKHPTWRYA